MGRNQFDDYYGGGIKPFTDFLTFLFVVVFVFIVFKALSGH